MKTNALNPEVRKTQKVTSHSREDGNARVVLSDDELEMVSAGTGTVVPTVNVDVLMGRHETPAGEDEHHP